eukprot:CAMPEP_0198214056 /NCGR_PEP_ID=MMETSP1445-20131203/36938_1 /TAXON_ID=36898 /ORGANISM="Pyramimonas sp., Strain CCMP2087" /LENGTH=258 /DNA_ID=CAMNT_0043889015 /DNA_START=134 /DNA_END=906 /DNA_ORIENTATION=+
MAEVSCQVYVGGISWTATEEDIKEVFSEVGEVSHVKIMYDAENGRNKGYGFVNFKEPHCIEEAIEKFSGRDIGGRKIKVNHATFTEKQDRVGRGKDADHRPHPYRRGGPSGGRGRQEQPYEEEEYTTREYYDKGTEVYPRGRAQREDQGYSRGAQYPSRAREAPPPATAYRAREPDYREYPEEAYADNYEGEPRRVAYRDEYYSAAPSYKEAYAEPPRGYSSKAYREAPREREEYYAEYEYGPGYDTYPEAQPPSRYP